MKRRTGAAAMAKSWNERHTGDRCDTCDTPYEQCTDMVFTKGKPCCSRCRYTGTHKERPRPPKVTKKMSLWWWLSREYHSEAYPGHSPDRSSKDCYECQRIVDMAQKSVIPK